MGYRNGDIPDGVLTVVGSGRDAYGYYEWQTTAATWARWLDAVDYALEKWGRSPRIRSGWNIYRPRTIQVDARTRACNSGNCNGAASPGYSSHGGNWNGRDCLAIDVDPNGLSWRQVDDAMGQAGFSVGLITQAISGIPGGEPWHYIDFNAFVPIPAGNNSQPFEEDDMFEQKDRNLLEEIKNKLSFSPDPGYGIPQQIAQDTEDIRNRVRGSRAEPWDMLQRIRSLLESMANASTPGSVDLPRLLSEMESRLRGTFQQQFEEFGVAMRAEILASLGDVTVEGGASKEDVEAAIDAALGRLQIRVIPAGVA